MKDIKELSKNELILINGGNPVAIIGGIASGLAIIYFIGYGVGTLMCD